jgi:hypothetical protein
LTATVQFKTEIFLAAFAKLQKVTVSFVMSVRPYARLFMEQLGCHWMDFHETWQVSIFRKRVKNIQASSKSDYIKEYFIR